MIPAEKVGSGVSPASAWNPICYCNAILRVPQESTSTRISTTRERCTAVHAQLVCNWQFSSGRCRYIALDWILLACVERLVEKWIPLFPSLLCRLTLKQPLKTPLRPSAVSARALTLSILRRWWFTGRNSTDHRWLGGSGNYATAANL